MCAAAWDGGGFFLLPPTAPPSVTPGSLSGAFGGRLGRARPLPPRDGEANGAGNEAAWGAESTTLNTPPPLGGKVAE